MDRRCAALSPYPKDETVLPTRSTKDRMACVSLAYLHERGVRTFCTSSTGNSSSSYAYAIADHPDMRVYLFTAERFISRVQHADHDQVRHFCMRDASFVDAFEYAGTYARANGPRTVLCPSAAFSIPGRLEELLSWKPANRYRIPLIGMFRPFQARWVCTGL